MGLLKCIILVYLGTYRIAIAMCISNNSPKVQILCPKNIYLFELCWLSNLTHSNGILFSLILLDEAKQKIYLESKILMIKLALPLNRACPYANFERNQEAIMNPVPSITLSYVLVQSSKELKRLITETLGNSMHNSRQLYV